MTSDATGNDTRAHQQIVQILLIPWGPWGPHKDLGYLARNRGISQGAEVSPKVPGSLRGITRLPEFLREP